MNAIFKAFNDQEIACGMCFAFVVCDLFNDCVTYTSFAHQQTNQLNADKNEDSLTVQDSGCAETPNIAPEVTIIPGNMESYISWTPSGGATNYQVFRTEGLNQCGLGKVKLTTTTSLSYTDIGLMNGREYYYVVIAKGPNDSCFGPASPCTSVIPTDAPPPTQEPSKKPSVRDITVSLSVK